MHYIQGGVEIKQERPLDRDKYVSIFRYAANVWTDT